MTRLASLLVGVGLVATTAAMVLPEPRGWINDPAVLCPNGHPMKRLPTDYDGLPTKRGYERDHIVPRCLGGPDIRSNLQYQPWPEPAETKNTLERHSCEAYCANPSPQLLQTLRAQFHREYP